MRHNPSTVVVLAGPADEQVLALLGRSLNVVLVRPAESSAGGGPAETAAGTLRRAARVSAPYVLVTADPLGGVAAAWQAMWAITAEPRGSDEFELAAAEALAAWRAQAFELPDYYLVLADETPAGGEAARGEAVHGAGFHLGPLRSVRPNRVAAAAAAGPAARASAVLSELGSLRHGPWWPSLEDVIRTARGFYPGTLAESPAAGRASLLS